MFSVLNCTTVSDYYPSFSCTLCQLEIRKTQTHFQVVLLSSQQTKKAGKHKTRKINSFCQVTELLNQFDLQHPSPADYLKYKLNLRFSSLFWPHTLKILKGSKGVKMTMLNLARIQLLLGGQTHFAQDWFVLSIKTVGGKQN